MIDFIHKALPSHYGLRVKTVNQVQGGWCASAFVAETDHGRYFVKIFDKHRPSIQPWIQRMAHYMPAVLWLSNNTPLTDRMIAPILAGDEGYKVENADFILLIYPYVEGETLCERRLSPLQIHQLADTLALLHSYGENIPVPLESITETYSLPFLKDLIAALEAKEVPKDLQAPIKTHAPAIRRAICSLECLAEQMRGNPPANALCHSDVHGWNLMWSKSLLLIDWEGLQLAPVESDLFTFTSGFFFDYAGEDFFSAYKKTHPNYVVNETAMLYYRLRRRLEDIAAFIHSVAYDDLTPQETEKSIAHLHKECEALA